ncbi:hypothetical protein KCP77_09230 [Salmonella enterica subsp. enterica]|nr:hypothetical protein KCP77_09230 [Salmonella enterica subsp. enterica]
MVADGLDVAFVGDDGSVVFDAVSWFIGNTPAKSKVLDRCVDSASERLIHYITKKHSRQAWYCWYKQVTWPL